MNLFELFVKIGVDDQASGKLKNIGQKLGSGLKTAANIGVSAVGVAATAITALTTQAVNSFAEYEQLAGGAQKIFDQIDYSKIATDANDAYKELGLSANQYLSVINDVGATFAATMGDAAGYEAAKTGLKAISDYASGTGKNVDELSQKFTLITRSTSSYQSIADQFSGILPATSKDFLKQAQAAGLLSKKYKELTKVPIAEYQEAVSKMLEQGVSGLGLANNTMNEAFSTLSGSLAMAKGSWSNLVTGLADDSADLDMLIGNFVESVGAVANNLIPKIGTALNGAIQLIRDLVPTIVNEIPPLIENNLPMLAEAAISIIQSLVDAISSNREMLVSTVLGVAVFLIEQLLSMIPNVLEVALALIITLANGISDALPQLIPALAETVQKIVEIITDNLPMILEAAISIVENLANGLLQELPELLNVVITAIGKILSTILKALPEFLPKILDVVVEALPILVEAVMSLLTELVKLLPEYTDALLTFAPSIISALVIALMNSLPVLLDGIVQLAGALMQQLPQLLVALLVTTFPISLLFIALYKILEHYIGEDLGNKILEFLGNAWEKISKFFVDVFDFVKDFASKLITSSIEAFEKMIDFAKELPSKVFQFLKKIISFVSDFRAKIINAIVDIITKMVSNAKEKVKKFTEIGKNIVDGVKSGIQNAWSNLKKWFRNLFGDLIGIAKKILGIASPSKVFKKLGSFTADGFGIGFEDEFAHVKDDMEDALNFDDASVGINASIRKVGAGAVGGAFGGTSIGNITINIDGAKYANEQSLAEAVAEAIQSMTDRRAAVYA